MKTGPLAPDDDTMSKLILTIDDSRSMRDMLKLALSEAGFEVVQAVDGVHGIEVLKDCNPDVIVTDINMPRWTALASSKRSEKTQTSAVSQYWS